MVYTNRYVVGIEQIGVNNEITTKSLLSLMEDIASLHSATVGYGVYDVQTSRTGWILLNWRIKVIRRPKYNEVINAKTWSRRIDRLCAYRDFEFTDEDGNVTVIGTSRWVLFNVDTRRPLWLDEEIAALYQSEPDKQMFEDEIVQIQYDRELLERAVSKEYTVTRRDIDINRHMHNINYLDAALEIIPQEIYEKGHFDDVLVQYKKELKLYDKVDCRYICIENRHIVVMRTGHNVNAVVEFIE